MRQRFSTIWKYFELVKTNTTADGVYGECRHCSKTFDTRNTTSMFLHLKAKHETEYLKALADRIRHPIRRKRRYHASKYKKYQPEKEKIIINEDICVTKEEPEIFCEPELPTINTNSNDSCNELTENCPSPPLLLPLSNCQVDSNNAHESEQNASKSYNNNEIINNSLPSVLDLKYIKDNLLNRHNYFFLSVAAELDLLPDESKDLIKMAIWRIIYEVKQAKRSNVHLSLSNLLK